MAITAPETAFTRDVLGRYVCNSFDEARQSGPFDVVIIGGGTFGLALAQNLFYRSKPFDGSPGTVPEDGMRPRNFRILVLEAGPFLLPEHAQDLPNLQLFGPNPQPNLPACPLPTTRQKLIR
jgi:NADH dehydrogenase FAD-containing subunit